MLLTQIRIVRTVGYFSSGYLGLTRMGWGKFADSGGTMRVLCSERMEGGDSDALREMGQYDRRAFAKACRSKEPGHRELLQKAVASGVLDIRVAIPKDQRSDYLMHAKTGAAVGAGTGPIVWVGSANDTWAGWSANYEQVLSLHGPAYGPLATQVFTEFSRMWKGGAEGFRVVPAIEMARSGKTQSRRKRGSARWIQH